MPLHGSASIQHWAGAVGCTSERSLEMSQVYSSLNPGKKDLSFASLCRNSIFSLSPSPFVALEVLILVEKGIVLCNYVQSYGTRRGQRCLLWYHPGSTVLLAKTAQPQGWNQCHDYTAYALNIHGNVMPVFKLLEASFSWRIFLTGFFFLKIKAERTSKIS